MTQHKLLRSQKTPAIVPWTEMATATGPQYVEYASANETSAEPPIDCHDLIKTGDMPVGVENPRAVARALLEIDSWLPFASEAYQVSGNLRDFVVVPTTIFLTDIPNCNKAAFSFEEMSSWNTQAGNITFKTWARKPTHKEHANNDPTKAYGVIFDASMRPVPNYLGGLHRVVLLAGWDRNRYPDHVAKIAAGRTGFSMGAWVSDYSCACCGASLRQGGCQHVSPQRGVLIDSVGDKLVYRIAHGVTGFELSSVVTPAFKSAWGVPIG